jgi:hypothetical protein
LRGKDVSKDSSDNATNNETRPEARSTFSPAIIGRFRFEFVFICFKGSILLKFKIK